MWVKDDRIVYKSPARSPSVATTKRGREGKRFKKIDPLFGGQGDYGTFALSKHPQQRRRKVVNGSSTRKGQKTSILKGHRLRKQKKRTLSWCEKELCREFHNSGGGIKNEKGKKR